MSAAVAAEVAAIREAIDHVLHGPLYDVGCRDHLGQLRAALVEHEALGCCPWKPGPCLAAWVAEQINTGCRAVLAEEGDQ